MQFYESVVASNGKVIAMCAFLGFGIDVCQLLVVSVIAAKIRQFNDSLFIRFTIIWSLSLGMSVNCSIQLIRLIKLLVQYFRIACPVC